MDLSDLASLIPSWPVCLSLHKTLPSSNALAATLEVWSLGFKQCILRPSYTVLSSCLSSACFKFPSSSLTMVRHRLRSRYGGCRGGRGRSQPAPSPEIPLAPASPPSACVMPLQISSPEEEARPSGYVHTSEKQSQSDHESEQHGEDAGYVFNYDDVQAEEHVPDFSKPPDGDLQGVSGSGDLAECSYGIRGSVALLGGSGMVSEETKGDFWEGNACPVVEEGRDDVANV